MLVNTKTQERIDEYAFKRQNPDVSFPEILTDDELQPFDVAVLNYPAPPTPASNQKVVDAGVENVDGVWTVKYELAQMDQQETRAYAESVRQRRNQMLSETDWRFRSDLTPSQEWKDYCQALRDITTQSGFPFNVVWPNQPA